MQLTTTYRRLRDTGYRAGEAMRAARIMQEFEPYDGAELRIHAYPEEDNYFSVYGEPDGYTDVNGRRVRAEQARAEIVDILNRDGCWIVCCEAYHPDHGWQLVDSVGMCAGYDDPTDPVQNPYVVDLMQAGLASLPQEMLP